MTARDTYREPVSSYEAVIELRRVSGTQLDARFVEAFVEVLDGKDLAYRHGEDADFEAELALDKRIHDYVAATPGGSERAPAQASVGERRTRKAQTPQANPSRVRPRRRSTSLESCVLSLCDSPCDRSSSAIESTAVRGRTSKSCCKLTKLAQNLQAGAEILQLACNAAS